MKEAHAVVFVHGFWADASSFRKVIPPLLADGHAVHAVQNPLSSLAEDVAFTRRVLDRVEGPCVLVGHSWGGVVLSEAGNDPKVKGLVFLAALAPDSGQSTYELLAGFAPPPAAAYMEPHDGFIWVSRQGIEETFAQDLSAEEQAVMYTTQGLPHEGLFMAKVSRAAWREKPSWYLVATDDRSVTPEVQRHVSTQMGASVTEVKSGHVPMLSHPDVVVEVVRQALRAI